MRPIFNAIMIILKKHLVKFKLIFVLFIILLPFFSIAKDASIDKNKLQLYFDSVVSIDSIIPENARTAKSLGTVRQGSGVIIDNQTILTIGYIVLEAKKITIGLRNGKKIPGRLYGYDHTSGFGIISPIINTELKSLKLGDSNKIGLDEPLYILPSPFKGSGSVAKMVSRRPFAGWWEYYLDKPIYTLPTNQSWAGSPLINSNGEILGIGSLFIADAATPGIMTPGNMFVPINLLKPILKDLKKYGRRKSNIKPYIGLSSNEYNGQVIVKRVSRDGPSYIAGIKANDIITSVNGNLVKNLKKFYEAVWATGNSGVSIKIGIQRNGKQINFDVKSIDRMDYFIKNNSY